jgi:hypothetical protein
VGRDIDVDLTALQTILLIESTVVFWGFVPITSSHKGIPQQQRKVVMVQTLVRKWPFLKVQYE